MSRQRKHRVTFVLVVLCLFSLTLAPAAQASGDGARWCPLFDTLYDDPGCAHFGTIQEAVNAAKASHKRGNIYVLGNKTFTENVVIDGLRGVLIIANADNAGKDTIDGTVTMSHDKFVSLQDFTVTGGLSILHGTGPNVAYITGDAAVQGGTYRGGSISDGHRTVPFDGLIVNTTDGNVTVNRVTVNKGLFNGGDFITFNGTVRITHSTFNGNHEAGLYAHAINGSVILTDVSVVKSGTRGAWLRTTNGGIVIGTAKTMRNHFDGNHYTGLELEFLASGSATILDTTASQNGTNGLTAKIPAGNLALGTARSKNNQFNKNSQSGIFANVAGQVSLFDVTAIHNTHNGADLTSTTSLAGILLNTVHAGHNNFSNNLQNGLRAVSDGAIEIHNTRANANALGSSGFSLKTTAGGSATLTCSVSKNNHGIGLTFDLGAGTMFLNSFTQSGNGANILPVSGTGPIISTVSCPS